MGEAKRRRFLFLAADWRLAAVWKAAGWREWEPIGRRLSPALVQVLALAGAAAAGVASRP